MGGVGDGVGGGGGDGGGGGGDADGEVVGGLFELIMLRRLHFIVEKDTDFIAAFNSSGYSVDKTPRGSLVGLAIP